MKKIRWMTAAMCAALVMAGCGQQGTAPSTETKEAATETAADASADTETNQDANADTTDAAADNGQDEADGSDDGKKLADANENETVETTEAEEGTGGHGTFTAPERKPLDEVSKIDEKNFLCTFDGVQHDFILELPEQCENAPLIVMLHGYGMSAQAMKQEVAMEEKALPRGYAVVYVTGATDPTDPKSSNCWNSGVSANTNDDVGLITALVGYLQEEYGLSKERVYAAGFSNGGFMMHRLAMDAQDVFSAVVSEAGKMPNALWERRYEKNNVGVMQISGEKDELIPKNADGSAKHAIDPAIEDVMDYWAASNGLSGSTESSIGKDSTILKYEGDGKPVWSVVVKNGHHAWYDEKLTGIDINGTILDFFDAAQ